MNTEHPAELASLTPGLGMAVGLRLIAAARHATPLPLTPSTAGERRSPGILASVQEMIDARPPRRRERAVRL